MLHFEYFLFMQLCSITLPISDQVVMFQSFSGIVCATNPKIVARKKTVSAEAQREVCFCAKNFGLFNSCC